MSEYSPTENFVVPSRIYLIKKIFGGVGEKKVYNRIWKMKFFNSAEKVIFLSMNLVGVSNESYSSDSISHKYQKSVLIRS